MVTCHKERRQPMTICLSPRAKSYRLHSNVEILQQVMAKKSVFKPTVSGDTPADIFDSRGVSAPTCSRAKRRSLEVDLLGTAQAQPLDAKWPAIYWQTSLLFPRDQ